MTFKELFEEFDQEKLKSSAEKWLRQKFGDEYEFVFTPKLKDGDKTYHASINGKQFSITGRKYDTDGDGIADSVAYKIEDSNEEEPEKESDF